jgi:hypothetical protein
MVQREHAIAKGGVAQRGRAQLVGCPHQASLAVTFSGAVWLVRNSRSSSRP